MFSNHERIIYFDFIRAFAIFGVLACHIFASYVVKTEIFDTKLWYYSLFFNSLRDVSIPLFISLSGALLITKKDSVKVFIKKRFNKVIVPYIFWLLALIVFEIQIKSNVPVMKFICNTIAFPPVGPGVYLWFVQMIIVVYIVILALNYLIKINKSFLKLSLAIGCLYIFLLNFNLIPGITRPMNYICYSVFAIFGYYLATYDFANNKFLRYLKATPERLVVLFFILSILLYLIEIYFNAYNSISLNKFTSISQFSFLNVALFISVFLFFRYLSQSKGIFNKIFGIIEKGNLLKIILSISFCSYGIYLCHIIVKDFFSNVLNLNVYFSPSIYCTLLLFLVFICSWLLILLMSKIPILKSFSGV